MLKKKSLDFHSYWKHNYSKPTLWGSVYNLTTRCHYNLSFFEPGSPSLPSPRYHWLLLGLFLHIVINTYLLPAEGKKIRAFLLFFEMGLKFDSQRRKDIFFYIYISEVISWLTQCFSNNDFRLEVFLVNKSIYVFIRLLNFFVLLLPFEFISSFQIVSFYLF